MKTQPKALYLLNFISMWECFSYYGMRVLLVLYMIQERGFTDHQSFALYALYTTLIEFGGILGGVIADNYLGLKHSIRIGGFTILLGHLSLAFPLSPLSFYFGLGAIVAGTQLFRSNIPALVGTFYKENDPLRESGYTLYYTGINIGGFLASIFCGVIADYYGFDAGFGIAAVGMTLGMVSLYLGEKILTKTAEPLIKKRVITTGYLGAVCASLSIAGILYCSDKVAILLPFCIALALFFVYKKIRKMEISLRKPLVLLSGYLIFLVLFYACEEQLGSSLLLFAERHVERETLLGTIPSTSLITFNPLTILVIAPFLSKILTKTKMTASSKIGIGFTFLALSFSLLFAGSSTSQGEKISLYFPILAIIFMALGEIFVGPTIYAMASENKDLSSKGFSMGLVALGYALANFLSGELSQRITAVSENFDSLALYEESFLILACLSLLVSAFLFNLNYKQKVQYDYN